MKKTLTEKQLQANRANAQKSTGPKTPRGKSASARNAIKHGFFAKTILLEGEAHQRFLQLKNNYLRDFRPQTQDEFDLVDTLTANRWRIYRNWTLESVNLMHAHRQLQHLNKNEDGPTQFAMAHCHLENPPRGQEALSRREARLDRQYYKALDRLKKMVAEREERAERRARAEREERAERRASAEREAARVEVYLSRLPEAQEWKQRSHDAQQNRDLNIFGKPTGIPNITQKYPKQDPLKPTQNPLAA